MRSIEAVFISDLHLHPENVAIQERFNQFVHWARQHVQSVYILGDFFHVWPGDEALDAWSIPILEQLAQFTTSGIPVYFMPGNRDFLIGEHFIKASGVTLLEEPCVIRLHDEKILLMHGDAYCTNDKSHQWLRRLTRNRIFPKLFLKLPYAIRSRLVNSVRARSQANHSKPDSAFVIMPSVMIKHMQSLDVTTIIHGHIHKPGLSHYTNKGQYYRQYVLSDWDDIPSIVCYDETNGFYFVLNTGDEHGAP